MHRPLLHLATWLAASVLGSGERVLAQATGFLDDGFFGDGTTTVAPTGEDRRIRAVAAAPDGRLVIAGTRWIPSGENTLFWQALSDSAAGPLCSPATPAGALFATPSAIAFDDQGRMLVAGTASATGGSGYDRMVLRFLYPACTLDTSFSGDGVFLTGLSGADHFYDVGLDSADRIVGVGDNLDGPMGDDVLLVARLTSAGAFDGSFSSNGWLEAHTNDDLAGTACLQSGKLVIAGSAANGTDTVGAVARFWSDLVFADGFERGSTAAWGEF